MKIRTDFVTNSSSSSFILAFKNEKEYDRFEDECDEYDYTEFKKLINKARKSPPLRGYVETRNHKEVAKEFLKFHYSREFKQKLLDEKIGEKTFPDFRAKWEEENRISEQQDFKDAVEKYLNDNEEYQEKLSRINASDIIVTCEIWDSNGGLLKWAIRNDFVRQEFRHLLIHQVDIG